MTLDEAIQHCREKEDCTKCGQEHRQLREWLEDYKRLLTKSISETLSINVGDTVYFPIEDSHDRAQISYIRIEADNIYFGWVQYDYHPECTEVWDEDEFKLTDIGKTVFTTYEEAQKQIMKNKKVISRSKHDKTS